MENQNLSEETIEEIKRINENIRDLKNRIDANLQELIEELEYRRSLGEDI